MAGRKPKPTHLKLLTGNPGKRRLNKQEPTALAGLPVPPNWLSPQARALFELLVHRLDALDYASASHTEALTLAAVRLEEVEACTRTLNTEGFTYETTSTSGARVLKTRPEVALRNEAARHAHSLLAEFGLTPSAATKVVVPGKQQKNAFRAL